MYLGEIVESGEAEALREPAAPLHRSAVVGRARVERHRRAATRADHHQRRRARSGRIGRRAVRSIPVVPRRPRSAPTKSPSSWNCARDDSWPVTIHATSIAAPPPAVIMSEKDISVPAGSSFRCTERGSDIHRLAIQKVQYSPKCQFPPPLRGPVTGRTR